MPLLQGFFLSATREERLNFHIADQQIASLINHYAHKAIKSQAFWRVIDIWGDLQACINRKYRKDIKELSMGIIVKSLFDMWLDDTLPCKRQALAWENEPKACKACVFCKD